MEHNNTTETANCSVAIVGMETTVLELYGIFAAISVLFYLAAIAIIIKARAYRLFLHRLTIYVAVTGILRSIAHVLQILPVDINQPDNHAVALRSGWEGVCVFGGFMVQYASLLQAFAVSWICCYLFGLVVYQKQLKQLKHELVGLAIVSLAPFLFTWEPFITDSYGLLGTRCWIKDNDCHSSYDLAFIYQMTGNLVPNFFLSVLSLALLAIAVLSLSKKAAKKILQPQHWMAIKEILPLLIFPIVYLLVVFGRLLALVSGVYYHNVAQAFMGLSQLCSIALPTSLILRSSVRQNLRQRKKAEKLPLTTTAYEAENEQVSLI